MKRPLFVFFLAFGFLAFAGRVENSDAAIARAREGDFVIRKNGEKAVLAKADIDFAKARQKGEARIPADFAERKPIFSEHRTLFFSVLIFAALCALKAARKKSRENSQKVGRKNRFARKSLAKKAFGAIFSFCLSFFAASLSAVFYYKKNPVKWIPLYSIREREFEAAATPAIFKREWVEIEKMPQSLIKAVIAAEDANFLFHAGFSIEGIRRAMELNRRNKGGVLHGGSTISQQTAKNVFCTPSRSYFRKAVEAYFTVLIELIWGKRRILEVYLNVIETGDGIYGVQAAAKEFFGKDVARLTKSQAAQIAVTLPSPRRFASKRPSNYIVGRRNQILRYMDATDLSPLALDVED